MLLFLQIRNFGLTRAIQPAIQYELRDLMQLATIEKSTVSLAHVDDGAGQPPEVEAIHHFFTLRARPVVDAFRSWLHGLHLPLQHRGLMFSLRA